MSAERFSDPGFSLYDLGAYFTVECPKCGGRAHVADKSTGSRLTCTACFHTEQPGHWYGAATAYVSVKCRECHEPIRKSADWRGPWKKLATHCNHCGDDCEYEASITYHPMHQGRMTDSVYGLPLWYQAPWRDELVWAFHLEHLQLLRDYIAARHRERGILPRNTIRKSSSAVNKLPAFMTKAGNREEMIKLLDEMQQKQGK